MTSCYFTNLEGITISELKSTQNSIHAAMAWINFNCYGETLNELLNRGVKIKILLNNDGINQRYKEYIHYLNCRGAEIRLVSFAGIMHHKFCVIDNRICIFGSFNWTQSANIRNIEDLNICDEEPFVKGYLSEFNALWNLSKEDIQILRYPQICCACKRPLINILFMEQEGNCQTKIVVLQQCGCQFKEVYTGYYDISVYLNYIAAVDQFENDIAIVQQSGDEITYNQLVAQQDFLISNYLSSVRNNRMGLPIIHAVGIKAWRQFYKDDGEFYYKIIWKERGTEQYVDNEYEITL